VVKDTDKQSNRETIFSRCVKPYDKQCVIFEGLEKNQHQLTVGKINQKISEIITIQQNQI